MRSALAAALARLADDEALCARLGAAGRDWALRHGSVETMGLAYRVLYGGAIGPTPGYGVPSARGER